MYNSLNDSCFRNSYLSQLWKDIQISIVIAAHEFLLNFDYTRREFLREILYKNIAIIAIQHSKNIDKCGKNPQSAIFTTLSVVKNAIKFSPCKFLRKRN